MPSVFPGMDPYLEQLVYFHDFHNSLPLAIRSALLPSVRPKYFISLDSTVYLEGDDGKSVPFGASDVSLGPVSSSIEEGGGLAVLDAPKSATITMPPPGQKDTFLEIRDRLRNRVISVIEIFSPNVKRPGKDRQKYLVKREEYLRSEAHLIEIDLLRGGTPMPLEGDIESDYRVVLSRVEQRPTVGVWPVSLREPLPTIPVPLAGSDPDVTLDLQAVFTATFDQGGYEDYIYRGEPEPPLAGEDAAWAATLLKAAA